MWTQTHTQNNRSEDIYKLMGEAWRRFFLHSPQKELALTTDIGFRFLAFRTVRKLISVYDNYRKLSHWGHLLHTLKASVIMTHVLEDVGKAMTTMPCSRMEASLYH
jgi:hypothetical protein